MGSNAVFCWAVWAVWAVSLHLIVAPGPDLDDSLVWYCVAPYHESELERELGEGMEGLTAGRLPASFVEEGGFCDFCCRPLDFDVEHRVESEE